MSDEKKRYYWLKLPEDFFRDKAIKKLRSIAGGDTYTIIYLKMLLKSLANDGHLYFEGIEDSIAEEIALDIDEQADDVQVAMNFLISKGLMICTDSEVELMRLDEMIGSESESAKRVRKMRNKEKAIVSGIKAPEEVEAISFEEKQVEEPVVSLILKDNSYFPVYQNRVDKYTRAYPNVDVLAELKKMVVWCEDNESKRKTPRGIKRFINNWLSRENSKDKGNHKTVEEFELPF